MDQREQTKSSQAAAGDAMTATSHAGDLSLLSDAVRIAERARITTILESRAAAHDASAAAAQSDDHATYLRGLARELREVAKEIGGG